MRVALYNIDSVLPNVALMKISSYFKKDNNDVEWLFPLKQYDIIYASKVFRSSIYEPYDNMVIGGTGYDECIKLEQAIDDCDPDYSLYPSFKDSIGFITRGCDRDCHFCVVPKKEGKIAEYRNVKDVWRGGNLILFDNNILLMPDKFVEVIEFCKKKNIKVDFNQGLDCRLVNKEIANLILNNKSLFLTEVRFAFDNINYRESVENCIRLLNGKRCLWYVYVDEDFDGALERLLILKRLGQRTFVMRDEKVKGIEKYNILAHYSNSMAGMQAMDIITYVKWYCNRMKIENKDQIDAFTVSAGE